MSTVQRVCVFAQLYLPGLGDVLQRNILLALLRRTYPGASVTFVLGEGLAQRFADLLENHMYATGTLRCPNPGDADPQRWRVFLSDLADRRFDLCVVDPGTHTLDAGHARQAGVPVRVAMSTGRPSDQDITRRVRLPPPSLGFPDIYEYTTAFAHALGVAPESPAETLPELPRRFECLPELDSPAPRIGVHPGGQRLWNRRWPLARFSDLCVDLVGRLGASLYLFGDDDDRREMMVVRDRVRQRYPEGVVHLEAGGPLNRAANLIAGLDLLVGNDSGPAHIAAAVGTPTVVLYGPTGTQLMWSRIYTRHTGVSLRYPCQAITHDVDQASSRRCEHECTIEYLGPDGPYPQCLVDLSPEQVWAAVVAQLRAHTTLRRGALHV